MTQAIASRHSATIDPGSAIDPSTLLAETVDAIWTMIEQAATDGALDPSRGDGGALLARRELVQRGTGMLSRSFAGASSPAHSGLGAARGRYIVCRSPSWRAVAGHCVLGFSTGPSLRARTAVQAALEVLRP